DAIDESKVVGTVLPIAATVVTSFRLFVRTRQRRLWLDDAWAAIAMVFIIVWMVIGWLYLDDYGDDVVFSARARSSRISILYTVVRLIFPGALRRTLVLTAVVFMVTWMILGAQILWTCEAESGWKMEPHPQCDIGRNVVIAQVITDVLSDTILILAPFRLIYNIKLTKAQKIRLLSTFSTSAVTTVVSLSHAYYALNDGGLKAIMAATVEVSISLIVANLSVVVAFLFRISTEETTTPALPELKSIVTIGSQPIRKRPQVNPFSPSTMVVTIETTTIKLDDFSTSPEREAGKDGNDAEVESLRTLAKPGPFYDGRI
ncbi:hypothetical protein BKA82DRAFT_148391, partial [Pisolithus tinctorius]